MSAELVCPHCDASMQGDPIPAEHRAHKADCDEQKTRDGVGCYCLPYGDDVTHFSRVWGHEIRGVYDGVLYWVCPDCDKAWPRFTGADRLGALSAEYVAVHNAVDGAA